MPWKRLNLIAKRARRCKDGFLLNVLLPFVALLIRLLPTRIALRLAGYIASRVGRRTRIFQTMCSSVREAFPDMRDIEVQSVVKKSWENLGKMAVDLVHSKRFLIPEKMQGQASLDLSPSAVRFLHQRKLGLDTRPIIIVSGHICAAQAAISVLISRIPSKRFCFVYRKSALNNQWWESSLFTHHNFVTLSNKNPYRKALSFLKEGQDIIILVDRKVRSGAPIFFFNRTVRMTRLAALLAVSCNAVILPGWGFRSEDGGKNSFLVTSGEIIAANRNADHKREVLRITQEIATYVEKQVKKSPEDWLWVTKDVLDLFRP